MTIHFDIAPADYSDFKNNLIHLLLILKKRIAICETLRDLEEKNITLN